MESVVEALLFSGHQIEWRFGNAIKEDITDRSVKEFNSKHHLQPYVRMPVVRNVWRPVSRFFRSILGYRIYLKPGWTSIQYKEGYLRGVNWFIRYILMLPMVEGVLCSQWLLSFLRYVLRGIPSNSAVLSDLKRIRPDVVAVTSNLPWDAQELEYLKAAMAIGIPTAVQIASWDNLTTKSTLSVIPDAILLWNDAIKTEAEVLHDIPAERVVVSGAATFDYVFTFKQTKTRFEFCKQAGFADDEPFVVYLGSSKSIAGDETEFVRELVRCLRVRLNIRILIRPHPVNYKVWNDFNEPGCVVWPKGGELPDTIKTKQDFLETLHHSVAVVGVNTSAIIESAILNKPCISIKSKQFETAQSEDGHFRHLSGGQFLEIAGNIEQATSFVGEILKGNDRLQEKRINFVSNFIRPNGMEKPVGSFIADTLVSMAIK